MQKVTKALLDKKGSRFFKFLFVAYTVLLVTATLLPTNIIQSEGGSWMSKISFENGDKVVHAALFFIFTFMLYLSGFVQKKNAYFFIPFSTGILIECIQHLSNLGRTFDVWDIVGNTIGILIAYFLLSKQILPRVS